MPKQTEKVVITQFDAYNERINIGNKYIVNKEKDVKKSHWREHLVSLIAFTPLKDNNDNNNKIIRHQERSYERMRLSLSRETSLRSPINESLDPRALLNKTLFIDQKPIDSPRKLSVSGSLGSSISDDSHSDTDTERDGSGSQTLSDSSSLSSSEFGSDYILNDRQNSGSVRIVQRFGSGFEDSCLFPLALTLDLSDLSKGKITWDTINSKADLVLDKWCSLYSRNVNRVLSNASDFICPEPSLQNRMLLLSKKNNKPLKRWNSYEDLYCLSRQKIRSKTRVQTLSSTDDTLFARQKFDTENTKKHLSHRKSSVRSVESNELILLEPITSPLFVKSSSLVQKTIRIKAKSLLRNIRANSPLSLALYVTEIDKQYFLRLKDRQLFECMLGDCSFYDYNQQKDIIELQDILEFGTELNKFVVSIIRKQITPENQGIKIAGFIEVACILRKLRNWHSLVTVIRALQSPRIYFMEEAWMAMKKAFPIHFNDYIKLCRLVRLNQTCIIGSTIGSSIPSLASLLSRISIHCIATWDLLENKRRWTEQPSIAGWVDSELIGQLVESQKLRQKQEERYMLSLDGNHFSLLPDNDPIRLIPYSSLPSNWTKKDIKYITNSYMKPIVKCFQTSFQKEMHLIRHYTIPTAYT